ncbi:uncharacterized protein LOC111034237 isoform X2 [Myzus persicae]|uniref:uncharacterized protein LOC111034237 isoform X2 n=1 Tax=Myzus persicae TaxID=13164 RepID=UPI000B9322CA|nr:uncharacterized protein LOC111034237 isoform X2 [Myzus persicae]
MSAKTIFYAFAVVALAAVWSAQALPLTVDDVTSPANAKENLEIDTSSEEVVQKQESEQQQMKGTDTSVLQTDVTESSPDVQQSSQAEEVTVGSEIPVVGTDSVLPEVSNKKSESDVPTTAIYVEQTDSVAGTNSPNSDAKPNPSVPVQGQKPKPYYTGEVQTVKVGPNMPFFLEFFQPFQSFQPFQPFQPFMSKHPEQPFRHQPIPFGAPFDPFANPMNAQPFNQMVEAYTNEFRSMLESFDKMGLPPLESVGVAQEGSNKPVRKTTSKTEIIDGHRVQINETTVSDGDENHKSFYHFKEIQVLPEEMNKKMSNEKLISISNDDSETQKVETNEIKPVPSVTMQNFDDRKNFVKKTPAGPLDDHFQTAAASYYAPYAPLYGSRQQPAGLLQQKQYHGSYHTPNQGFYPAPNQGYYPPPNQGYYPAPNQGYYPVPNQGFYPAPNQVPYPPQNHGSRPSQPPISLHGDTLVNELVAAQQQSSGGTVLPPDVEFVDVNGKPQPSGQYHQYNSHNSHNNNNIIINDKGNRGHEKLAGRKY